MAAVQPYWSGFTGVFTLRVKTVLPYDWKIIFKIIRVIAFIMSKLEY